MKAAFINKFGDLNCLEVGTLPTPKPASGEVRVRIRASGLNHLDVWVRRGLPFLKLALPHILGGDGAGLVDKLGLGVEGFSVGDEVIVHPGLSDPNAGPEFTKRESLAPGYRILGEHVSGTNAEYVCVPAENIFPKPKNLDWDQSASLGLVFTTAWEMVRKAGDISGQMVVVHAAGSGVSAALIQICKHFGARVIATASDAKKLELAEQLGAHAVINYKESDFVKSVRAITGKAGPAVIFDHVGKDTWEKNVELVGWGGTIVICGATTGNKATLDLRHVFYRQLRILGSTMGSKCDFPEILDLFRRGVFRATVGAVFSLNEIRQAHAAIERRQIVGKVVLQVSGN